MTSAIILTVFLSLFSLDDLLVSHTSTSLSAVYFLAPNGYPVFLLVVEVSYLFHLGVSSLSVQGVLVGLNARSHALALILLR